MDVLLLELLLLLLLLRFLCFGFCFSSTTISSSPKVSFSDWANAWILYKYYYNVYNNNNDNIIITCEHVLVNITLACEHQSLPKISLFLKNILCSLSSHLPTPLWWICIVINKKPHSFHQHRTKIYKLLTLKQVEEQGIETLFIFGGGSTHFLSSHSW